MTNITLAELKEHDIKLISQAEMKGALIGAGLMAILFLISIL